MWLFLRFVQKFVLVGLSVLYDVGKYDFFRDLVFDGGVTFMLVWVLVFCGLFFGFVFLIFCRMFIVFGNGFFIILFGLLCRIWF
jgi:hypothetical protein